MNSTLRERARQIKTDVQALLLAGTDPRVPRSAKLLAMAVVAYALSPIDLIPDFIPVLGYLDDLIIVPLGVRLVIRLIPDDVWADLKERASNGERQSSRLRYAAALAIIAVWVGTVVLLWRLLR